MSVLLEFAMFPISADGREGAGVSAQVSKIIDMIDQSGVSYQLTSMSTIIETETLREALDIIEKSYAALEGCERVYSTLTFDIRTGKSNRMKAKIAAIEGKIGHEVHK